MRHDWEEWQNQKAVEKEGVEANVDHLHDFDDVTDDVHSYFTRTAKNTPMMAAMEKEKKEGSSEDDVKI
jgi:hypothetical protein